MSHSGTFEPSAAFEYVDTTITPDLLCAVCHEPFIDPHVLPCDHTFCMRCLGGLTSQDTVDTVLCPLCRKVSSWRDVRKSERVINNLVNKLLVYCRHRAYGCPLVLQRGNMKDHLRSECQYTFTQCPNDGCQVETLRKFLSDHVLICPNRGVVHDCGLTVKFSEMEAHLRTCSLQRTTCYHCKREFHEIETRTAHESQCEMRSVPCPWHKHGCDVLTPASGTAAHLLICTYEKLKNYIGQMEQKLKDAEEKLVELRSTVIAAELRGRNQLDALESRMQRDALQLRTYMEIIQKGGTAEPPLTSPSILHSPAKEEPLNAESPIDQGPYASRQLQTHGTMIEFQWFITKLQRPKGSLISPNFHLADLEWQLSVDGADHGIYLAANGRAVYATYMVSVVAGDLRERKKRSWVSVGEKEFGQMKWGTQGVMSLFYGKDIVVTAALLHVISPVNLMSTKGGEWVVGVDSHHGTEQTAGEDKTPIFDRSYE